MLPLARFVLCFDWREAGGFANSVDVFREAGLHSIARLEIQILHKILAVHIGDIRNTFVRYSDPSFGQQLPQMRRYVRVCGELLILAETTPVAQSCESFICG
jgi:hypothetical protein